MKPPTHDYRDKTRSPQAKRRSVYLRAVRKARDK
jgi:hypothetical protein